MQTFVTHKTHAKTMRALDNDRLEKQRAETIQILSVLRGETDGYANHPAVRMWEGYEPALVLYGLFVAHEWRIERGHNDTTWGKFAELAQEYGMVPSEPGQLLTAPVARPAWLDDLWVLRSHRSNLLRKAEHHYGEQFPGTPDDMPYLWPLNDDHGSYKLYVSKADVPRLANGERVLPDALAIDLDTREVTVQ